jgi:hypothetical protein
MDRHRLYLSRAFPEPFNFRLALPKPLASKHKAVGKVPPKRGQLLLVTAMDHSKRIFGQSPLLVQRQVPALHPHHDRPGRRLQLSSAALASSRRLSAAGLVPP